MAISSNGYRISESVDTKGHTASSIEENGKLNNDAALLSAEQYNALKAKQPSADSLAFKANSKSEDKETSHKGLIIFSGLILAGILGFVFRKSLGLDKLFKGSKNATKEIEKNSDDITRGLRNESKSATSQPENSSFRYKGDTIVEGPTVGGDRIGGNPVGNTQTIDLVKGDDGKFGLS